MSKQDVAERFWSKVDVRGADDCWEWQGHRDRKGYGKFQIENSCIASRVAWELTNGEIPDGMMVLHSCDNPPCCNPAHLSLGSGDDNMKDMVRKGRSSRGLDRPNVALTPEIVTVARRLYRTGRYSVIAIASRFGVNNATLHAAITGFSWMWLEEPPCSERPGSRDEWGIKIDHRGTRNGRCKLTPEQVLAIKQRRQTGETLRALAAEYGVSDSTIGAILSGQNWGWLKEPA